MDGSQLKARPAGHVLAEALIAAGATHAWCVPGESYLGLLDGLRDQPGFRIVTARHEGGAGFMALTHARLTGQPGLLMISRGPGMGNAMIAAHVAEQDGVPLILLIGQVPRDVRNRGAFQEVDYSRTFSDIAKEVIEINDPRRVAEFAAQAWRLAVAGRPGPVVLSLPEDMLLVDVATPVISVPLPARAQPTSEALRAIAEALAAAERPLLLAGEALASQEGRAALLDCAVAWGVPVLCGHKHQDLFPNRHPAWAGHIGHVVPEAQSQAWAEADLIIAAGSLLGDVDTQGYIFPHFPMAAQSLIQIHHDPVALARHYCPELAVCADATETLTALARLAVDRIGISPDWTLRLHRLTLPVAQDDAYAAVLLALDGQAAENAIFAMDSGRFASAAHRLIAYGGKRQLLGTASGAMGNGVPAAVAAAVLDPGRQVIAIVGDGGLLMTGNELATALREDVPIRILVANNAAYGAIAGHQDRLFPGRRHSMELANPDFQAWAAAFGALGLKVTRAEEAAETVQRFLNHPGSAVLEVLCD